MKRLIGYWLAFCNASLVAGLLGAAPMVVATHRWWPAQALPKAIVRSLNQQEFPQPRVALQMMMQSVAGLAAQAVNERRSDELVWVNNGNVDLEEWYARLLAAHPELTSSGPLGPWELVDRYAKRGVVKGYILFRLDQSRGEINAYRPGMDYSVNVATSLAGVLGGILVDEEIENEAKAHGLKRLLDVRAKTQRWCFQTYQDQFSRRMLCTQDPRKPHVRDLAIAQKAFTVYGQEEPTPTALKWIEPLSPILGWNGGDEFTTTDLSTRFGHIQTATDWCMNLPVLMAGTETLALPKARGLDPATIDWGNQRSAVSFIGTDGDNVQWLQGNFFHDRASYWNNPDRGKMPYGWSCCFAHLAQLCPQAIDYARATRSTKDSFVEWGGGYYYPDHFGRDRTNRWELLAAQARRTWEWMKQTDTLIIGFNLVQFDSPDARRAYEVIAGQTDGLLAILAFQYAPYEGGAGKTFWVRDRNGIELPVISARYSIWEHANTRKRAGTPAKIAREIRETVEQTPQGELPRYDWVIAHAWSRFRQAPGTDENAENLPQETSTTAGGVRGYSPTLWCAERLPPTIRVISPEELVWRIRMKHAPAQTKEFLRRFGQQHLSP
jgi:hypothetical protein